MKSATVKREADGSLSVRVNIELRGDMLEMEEAIAAAVSEVGRLATAEALASHDSDGQPIIVNNEKYTSKGRQKKNTKRPTERSS